MSSNKNSSNENSLVFDQQNSERANGVNSRISNLAEPSFSNGDHDDSLYDALSIDAQTPLKLEQSNANQESELTRANINNLNSYRESLKSQDTNRFSLIDLEYIKNSKLSNNLEPRTDQTDLMLDLKETSIDEILLIADDTHTGREPISIEKQFNSKNPDNNNPRENFEFLKNSERQKKNLYASPNDFFDLNDCKIKDGGQNENQKSKTNLQRLKDRINAINLNDKRLDDGLEIMKTPQPELVNDDFLGPTESKEKSKNEGAFKLYTTSIEENVISTNRNKESEKIEASKAQKSSNQSPFYSLDKQSICSNDVLNKSKRGPVKKYRSGSTSNLSSENKIKKPSDGRKLNNKPNSERIRPATHNEITYTLDSDESTIIDNLINNPDRLKQKLKQSRIERDQLNQLQQNYTRLLQQYAEAENFIDAFRLNAQIGGNSSNPTPVAKI
ncbi:hypothetical protein BpHYR1_025547 [Brachionus plicatilis]|uniref:Uncharacterized protein n=1 Tax=Brachionus plicatilis TaxID=10195 RepID=A0A3M7QZR3_BRAPC|nr:hypothetical protein BpHYR1_025547 [Brachionus plicatilis]